jgi:GSH-dependent disulfide-bond oxidoreductase
MIDLYGNSSPNVHKIAIMLEEIGCPYRGIYVDAVHGANHTPAFLALNPLAKVPVIVDHDGAGSGQPIFESGAILIYLAETYAPAYLPAAGPGRWEVLKWLIYQVAFAGPMLGQLNHFQLVTSQSDSYAADRYRDQAARVYADVEHRLGVVPWLGGENYSIADMAMYPWAPFLTRHGFDSANYPKLTAWRERIDVRPAVKRAYAALDALRKSAANATAPVTDTEIDRFFARSRPGPPVDFAAYAALGPLATVAR